MADLSLVGEFPHDEGLVPFLKKLKCLADLMELLENYTNEITNAAISSFYLTVF